MDELLQTTLDYIKKQAPQEYAKLDAEPEKKKEIILAARSAIEEEIKLASIGKSLTGEKAKSQQGEQVKFVSTELAKHLPEHRIQMIRKGLEIPTYRLNIRREGSKSFVDITRNGKTFKESRQLTTTSDIDLAKVIQYASILVEAVLLVVQAVGISIEVSDSIVAKVADEVAETVQSSSLLQKAIQHLQDVWENGGSAWDKATAIFSLIQDSYSAGILWEIIKGLCSNMSTWDWIKTAAIVSAMIIAAVATDGAALIAKIVLMLNSAYEFGKKLDNLTELQEIQKSLK